MRKHLWRLKRSHQAPIAALLYRLASDALATIVDVACARAQKTGDDIEQRALAGAIRPDQTRNRALLNVEIHPAQDVEPVDGSGKHHGHRGSS